MKYPFLNLAEVNAPYLEELRRAACRVIDSGHYIGGEEVTAFEQELASVCDTDCAVGVGNGLDALRLVLRAWMEMGRLRRDAEVIVPANSFVASALAVTECGLKVRFADVDSLTFNLDWNKIPLTARTGAIMPVHLYGRVCPIPDSLPDSVLILEDNAQAIGAGTEGRHTGSLGHAAGMSFYPTKNVGALGDAGAVTTSDPLLAAMVRTLANYGSDRRYHNLYAGVNSRLDPIQAAMIRVKLAHTDAENALRRENARAYIAAIQNPLVITPEEPLDNPMNHVWHQFVIRVTDGRRERFMEYMARHGVETAIHYPVPIYRQPCYGAEPHSPLPVAEMLAAQVVSLPIGRGTTPDSARAIAEIINEFK